jgi:hypothetical protein
MELTKLKKEKNEEQPKLKAQKPVEIDENLPYEKFRWKVI